MVITGKSGGFPQRRRPRSGNTQEKAGGDEEVEEEDVGK